jgi:6-pyruvoyltetrahydropterin/6-carboxytetrahydropterin synthase
VYSIKVEADFSAAHNLRGYKGKCEALHGHNWKVEVVVSRRLLDKSGMVLDFKILKSRIYKVLEKLDHGYLNKIPYFKTNNPTSENIARYIFDCLKRNIPGLQSVTVWESHNSCATYEDR